MQVDSESEIVEIDEMTHKPDVITAIEFYYEDMQ